MRIACNLAVSLLTLFLQACLSDQASVQQSLQQLQALGDQLKSQVDASSSAAAQSDHLSLTSHLATLEHALQRQQEILQVGEQTHERRWVESYKRSHCLTLTCVFSSCL